MYEVELKVRASHDEIESALTETNSTYVRHVTQRDTYYNAPHRDFATTDEALRIRREKRHIPDEKSDATSSTTELTYKGPRIDSTSKTRKEHEVSVGDDSVVADILDELGFDPAATVVKDRDIYTLAYTDDVTHTIVLDTVADLGEFIEAEATTSAESDIPAVRSGLIDTLATLGVDPDDQIQTSYLGLLLDDSSN
ncbi:class IV adenylate cyclase [Haloquadratum walsbyi]|uniref:Adenylyl cyclase CyaB, putative n=1 Tax=Haloquadratum walsbyi J07HQW2 TaxID=1238425 RepID=U1NDH1_9EURY|nr:class IV adenylate cyclase [Haloquadratum walsbyi]ERG94778.1 MAG: adenylyl cyclase CyaB, putative [Haloquadratum walsbyi J07HQW2]